MELVIVVKLLQIVVQIVVLSAVTESVIVEKLRVLVVEIAVVRVDIPVLVINV
jgi:hypothetical protein